MKIIPVDITPNYPAATTETVATVGFFDGVHRGHRYLLEQVKARAATIGLPSAVVTFSEHPRKVLRQDYQPRMLHTPAERLAELADTGIDYCYLLPFTPQVAALSAQQFIQQVLRKQLLVKELVIGYDHRFGKDRAAGYDDYVAYGRDCGMTVFPASEWTAGGHVSSSAIRKLLEEGRVGEAADKLTKPYVLSGAVVHGNHLGRTIGFPTANLDLHHKEKIVPREGVYAVRVQLGSEQFRGMAYIGTRPTVTSSGEQRVEVNLFDFDRDIYGETLQMMFVEYIRPDRHFQNLEELKGQLARDREACRGALGKGG